jgi:hypothetical protein
VFAVLDLRGGHNQSLKQLDGSNSGDADLLHGHLRRVDIFGVGSGWLQNQDAVVGHIGEESSE